MFKPISSEFRVRLRLVKKAPPLTAEFASSDSTASTDSSAPPQEEAPVALVKDRPNHELAILAACIVLYVSGAELMTGGGDCWLASGEMGRLQPNKLKRNIFFGTASKFGIPKNSDSKFGMQQVASSVAH